MESGPDWAKHITSRVSHAAEWRSKLQEMRELAEKWIYIRVGGKGLRPVSIHPDNPCGRLLNQGGSGKQISETKLLTALKNATEAAPANAYKPKNKKPEQTLQAGLIHHALTHDLLLDGQFEGFSDFFDELIFVTDEMKAGELRADMIALGGKQGVYFPVLIELKAKRTFEVVSQLVNSIQTVTTVQSSFVNMLAMATGKSADSIAFEKYMLLAVWPETQSGREKANPEAEVSQPGNSLAKGHLLIAHFPQTDDPHERFVSKITFRSQA